MEQKISPAERMVVFRHDEGKKNKHTVFTNTSNNEIARESDY